MVDTMCSIGLYKATLPVTYEPQNTTVRFGINPDTLAMVDTMCSIG